MRDERELLHAVEVLRVVTHERNRVPDRTRGDPPVGAVLTISTRSHGGRGDLGPSRRDRIIERNDDVAPKRLLHRLDALVTPVPDLAPQPQLPHRDERDAETATLQIGG